MSNTAQRMINNGIRKAIDEFDFETARTSLKTALKLKPDADTYYLASMLAENEKDKLKYLEKALDKDPFHEEAFAEFEHLTKQATPIQKTTKLPKKSTKTASSNNWSMACYQLGYFIACGAGIVVLGLLAPVIAAASVPAVIIGAVLAGVLVLGAGLGTIFKSATAEHRITEALMDETSEKFRADSRGSSYVEKSTNFMKSTAGKVVTTVAVTGLVTSALVTSQTSIPSSQPYEESSSARQPDYTGCYNYIYDNFQSMGLIYVEDAVEFLVHQERVSVDNFYRPVRAVTLEGVEYQIIGNRDFGRYITNDNPDTGHPLDWGICFFTGQAENVEFILTATSLGDAPPNGRIKYSSTTMESGLLFCREANREESCTMHGWTDEYGATAIYMFYSDDDQVIRFEIVK